MMYLLPGLYQYTYPTFVDKPQLICIHFLAPDQQNAFVSYPDHPARKTAELVPLNWFNRVTMTRLAGQPQLMKFLEGVLPGWISNQAIKPIAADLLIDRQTDCIVSRLSAA